MVAEPVRSGRVMSYFHDVSTQCGTELWINNPSLADINLGLSAGAVGIASNPLYIAALLESEPEFVGETIDEVIRDTGGQDDEQLTMAVIRKAVSRPLKMFHRLFEETRGRHGHVAIQGNPFQNDDLTALLNEAEEFRNLGENVIIKLPATVEGAQALEELTARGWSTIGTMSFSVDQYIHMAEAHRRGLQRTTQRPRCLITMLPGMFDDYLAEDADRRGVEISNEVRCQAGICTARAAWRIWRERNYEAGILSGGASSTTHWTQLVGHGMAMTLSGKLTAALIEQSPSVQKRVDAATSHPVIEELRVKFPDFVNACEQGSLKPEEFRDYGPVVRFQNSLAGGIQVILNQMRTRQ